MSSITWYGPQSIQSKDYMWRWALREFKEKIVHLPAHELLSTLNLIFDRFEPRSCCLHSKRHKNKEEIQRFNVSRNTYINAFYCSYMSNRKIFLFPKHMPENMWKCIFDSQKYIDILRQAQQFITSADVDKLIRPMVRSYFPERICTRKDYEFAVGIGNLEVLINGIFWWLLIRDTSHISDWGPVFNYFDILNRDFKFDLDDAEEILKLVDVLKHHEHYWARVIHSFWNVSVVKVVHMSFEV